MSTPSQGELNFLLKMRDEASKFMKQFGSTVRGTASEVDDLADSNDQASKSFGDVAKAVKDATAALTGFYTSQKLAGAFNTSWQNYEDGLLGVIKTTDMAGRELDEFRSGFKALNREMKGISTGELFEISGMAGQLGIRGSDSILKFTEVLGKLSRATDIQGAGGTQQVARILNLTKEGYDNVERFGDVLNYLGNNANATESQILTMAESLARGTAQFNMSSTALLGVAATAEEAGIQVELFGTASGRVMRAIEGAVIGGGSKMQLLASYTGKTREEFAQMLADRPEQALLTFADAYAQLSKQGSAGGLLEGLNLNTDEIKKVFGTLGSQIDGAKARMASLYAGDYEGALDAEVDKFFGAQSSKVENATRAVQNLGRTMGESLAPIVNLGLDAVAGSIDALADAFEMLPGPIKTVVAAAVVALPAIIALKGAFGVLSTVLGGMSALQMVAGLFKSIGGVIGNMVRIVVSLGGVFVKAFAAIKVALVSVGALLAGITAPIWALIAVVTLVAGVFIWVFRDQIIAALSAAWDALVGWGSAVKSWFDSWFNDSVDIPTQVVPPDNVSDVVQQAQKEMAAVPVEVAFLVGDNQKILDEIDGRRQLVSKINDQKDALIDMRRVMDAPARAGDFTYTEKDFKRMQGLVSINEEALDPVRQRVRELTKEIASAGAVTAAMEARLDVEAQIEEVRRQVGYLDAEETAILRTKLQMLNQVRDAVAAQAQMQGLQDDLAGATAVTKEQKNRLEIEKAIRDLMEERVIITQEEIDATARLIAQRQAAEQQNALREMAEGIKNRLELSLATTRAERERLEILQQINAWELANGKLKEDQYATLMASLQLEKQVANLKALQDTLDPVGAALRAYTDDMETLNAALRAGQIDQSRYNQLVGQLKRTTEEARSPVQARTRALRDEIAIMRLSGREQEVAKMVMSETNALKDKGVQVTAEMTAAMREYAQAMQDAKLAESGFAKWAEDVGTIEQNLGKLQESFADGLADAISGALSGDTQSFAKFAQNLGKQMVNMAVRQIMADAFKGFGNPKKDAALDRADAALAKLDALSSAGINAPQAIVNAGTVSVNGADLAGLDSLTNLPQQQDIGQTLRPLSEQKIASAVEEGVTRMSLPTQPIGSLLENGKSLPVTIQPGMSQAPIPVTVPKMSTPPANDNIAAGMTKLNQSSTALSEAANAIDTTYKDFNSWMTSGFGTRPAAGGQSTVTSLPQLPNMTQAPTPLPTIDRSLPKLTRPDVQEALTNAAQPAFTGRYAEVGNFVARGADKVNADLRQIMKTAAIEGGFNVEAYSGYRPGDKGFHGKGLAADVRLLDRQGKIIGGSQYGGHYQTAEGFKEYERFAQEMKRVQMRDFPELDQDLRWGGYFGGPKGKYGALDGMHFDLGGKRVGMAGGSWANGLTQQQRSYFPGIESIGMNQGGQPNMPHLQNMNVDTSAVTNSINQMNTSLQGMKTTMQPMPQQITTATTALQGQNMQTQNLGATTQQAGMNMSMMNPAMQQVSQGTQQAGQAAQAAGPAFQQAGQQVQQAAQQAKMAGSGVGQFGMGVQGLQGPLSQATSASGSFGNSLMQLVQQMMSGMGGGGGFGGIMGLFGGLFADGGLIRGPGTGRSDSILAGVSNGEFIVNAKATKDHLPLLKAINDNKELKVPGFADGGQVRLTRGEQSMRARRPVNDNSGMIKELIEAVGDTKARKQERGGNTQNNSVNLTVYAQDAASFRRSEGQLLADSSAKLSRMGSRNN